MAGIALATPAQVGAAIRGARIRQGVTQTELATRAGVSRRWLIALERGQAQRAELGKILDTFDALGLDLTVTRTEDHRSALAGLLENP